MDLFWICPFFRFILYFPQENMLTLIVSGRLYILMKLFIPHICNHVCFNLLMPHTVRSLEWDSVNNVSMRQAEIHQVYLWKMIMDGLQTYEISICTITIVGKIREQQIVTAIHLSSFLPSGTEEITYLSI